MKKNMKKHSFIKRAVCIILIIGGIITGVYSYYGGLGTVKDAVSAIGFAIYQTEEMENLISWMREYNKSATQGNDIRFYGFDMQRREYNYQYLLEAVKNAGMDAGEINIHRDKMMAENIMWILKQEEARGNGRIFISGHNGHVKKSGNYDANNKVMGNLLANVQYIIQNSSKRLSCMGISRRTL